MTDAELCAALRCYSIVLLVSERDLAADRIEAMGAEVERLKAELAEAMRQRDAYRDHRDEALSRGMDYEHHSSCGHAWTMRHTACPTCYQAEREAHAKTKDALRDWQLGKGDTEMEAENKRLHAEIADQAHEWTLAMRDVVELRQRAERAEAELAAANERWEKLRAHVRCLSVEARFGAGARAVEQSMDALEASVRAWLDAREGR